MSLGLCNNNNNRSNSNNSKYQINRARSSREQCDVVRRSNAICCCHWQQLIPAEAALRMYDRDINSRPHRRPTTARTRSRTVAH